MSLKVLQSPAKGSTRALRLRAVPEAWTGPRGPRDMGLLNLWLEYESESNRFAHRINWGAVSGLALSFAISAGFWTGVGLMVAHFLR
jgi:hypothetical protein